jgi:signal transduction histidine kinase
MKLHRPDGEVRHILVSTAVGEFLGMDVGQAVVIDITDRYERDRQLQILDHWLRHNIRNEINVISGLAERIERTVTEDVTESVRRLREHCRRLVDQSNAQRQVIELLTDPPDPEIRDIARIVERQVETGKERYPEATIAIERGDELHAPAIPEFEAAIDELIGNAIRHSDAETPTVSVAVVRDGDQGGLVRIADNGPGIPTTERDALRLDREIDQLTHGSGLGLVFVKWVLRLAGGTVSFGDNEPRGAVVTLRLPAADEE